MIGQVCIKPLVTAAPDSTIQAAARLMREKNVGALVIAQNSKAKGFLTDRDIAVDVVAKGVRRLPVVGKGGKLVGMISLDDLLMLLGSEMGNIALALSRGLGRRSVADSAAGT